MPTARIPVDITWSIATGSPGVNVFHGRGESGLPPTSDFDGLSAMLEDFYTAIANIIPNTCTFRQAGEAYGVGDDAGEVYALTPWTVTGTSTGGYAPPATAMLVQWRTGSGGNNGRGRSFISPVTNAIVEANGTPDETARGIVQTAADDLVEASDSFANGALGVYSRTESTLRDFVTANVPNVFAVLRSRRD